MNPILLTVALTLAPMGESSHLPPSGEASLVETLADAANASRQEVRGLSVLPEGGNSQQSTASPIPTRIAVSAFMVGQFTDISITQHYIGKGVFQEANPLLRWAEQKPVAMAAVKGSIAVAVSWLLLAKHKDHPKAVFWTSVALASVQAAITYHNYRESQR